MAKTKVSEWSNISDNNLDVGGINIADDMPPSFVNDAMREMMAQIKQWQSGQYAEPMTITGDLDIKGGMKLNSSAGTSGQFLMSKGDGVTPQWGNAVIPDAFSRGMIILWSGTTATIPTGWRLCDGGEGTPNLVSRFVMGAGVGRAVGDIGGSADATLVSHNHTGSTGGGGSHSHTYSKPSGSGTFQGGGAVGGGSALTGSSTTNTSSVGNHTHSVSISTKGSSATNKNLPPYYALAYIMRL